jgi:hypothetical protein
MKTETYNILLDAYASLEQITFKLYNGADNAVARDDLSDASLLQSRADILYEQLEYLDVIISEHEE